MSSDRRGRPRDEKAHDAVLTATGQLLIAEGYEGLSVDRVARAAGVGKQTIYRWWGSKTALVTDAALHGFLALQPLPARTHEPVLEELVAVMDSLLTTTESPGGGALLRALVVVAATDHAAAAQLWEQLTTPAIDSITALVREGIDRGHLASGTVPATLAEAIIGASLLRSFAWHPAPPDYARTYVSALVHPQLRSGPDATKQ